MKPFGSLVIFQNNQVLIDTETTGLLDGNNVSDMITFGLCKVISLQIKADHYFQIQPN